MTNRLSGRPATRTQRSANETDQVQVVYLVRHGRVHNPDCLVYGRLPGFDLSLAGRIDATAAGERLRDMPITELWTSPLQRATSTAALIRGARKLPVRVDTRLTEVSTAQQGLRHRPGPSDPSGKILLGTHRPFPDALEPVVGIRDRMLATICDAFAVPGSELVLVSHQVPIAIAIRALGLSSEVVPDVPEASVIELRRTGDRWLGGLFTGPQVVMTDPFAKRTAPTIFGTAERPDDSG